MDTALKKHPSMEASAARVDAAATGIVAASASRLPRVDYTESWQRSNNPVFVFSSLLTQHQFGPDNFQIRALNRPDALDNFQSQIMANQPIYDGGLARAEIHSATAGMNQAREQSRAVGMGLTASVVRAYFGMLLADADLKAAQQAVKSAQSDLERAESIRAAGMSTDADVLSIRVHLSAMRQQEIARKYDAEVALAQLNELLGAPLDTPRKLTTPLEKTVTGENGDRENTAVAERPEIRQAHLRVQSASDQVVAARAGYLPRVSARFAFEADRQRFVNRGAANWLVGASLEWNLFSGLSNQARKAAAEQSVREAKAEAKQADAAVRVEVRRAEAGLNSANEQLAVAEAAIAMAEESLRITKNRYESGLTTVTELLRNETALLDARTRHLGAVANQRVAAANLELATGTLSGDSNVLK